jgi:hypothetical protein
LRPAAFVSFTRKMGLVASLACFASLAALAAEPDATITTITDIGDRLENTRDRIETHTLWAISKDELSPLKAFAERHLREPG